MLVCWRAPIAPIERPNPRGFTPELVARGEVLAAEGHCSSCHHGHSRRLPERRAKVFRETGLIFSLRFLSTRILSSRTTMLRFCMRI
jgi:hypothetical protein